MLQIAPLWPHYSVFRHKVLYYHGDCLRSLPLWGLIKRMWFGRLSGPETKLALAWNSWMTWQSLMFIKTTCRWWLPLSFFSSYSTMDTWGKKKKTTFHQQRLITSAFRDATLAQDITYSTQVRSWHWPRVQSNKHKQTRHINKSARKGKPLTAQGETLQQLQV